ncbi:MAG: hypothetical protein K2O67_02480, partial [Clostridia bacterium]|nr:hypothetical protein [Clostridia bacterium]
SLTAQWKALPSGINEVQGNQESISVEFTGRATTTVQYKKNGASDWTSVDAQLVRSLGGNSSRVDILGLSAGSYTVKVGSTEISDVRVTAYDRSGYAHWQYNEGIGAYNDDGNLKDNAIVIYVTEDNKDTVMEEIESQLGGTMFNVPGADWKNQKAAGIGWWLNNAQYTKTDKKGNKGNTWASNGSSLGFGNSFFDNKSICVRIIGEVTTPEGCTAYDSLNEGGSVGDNGHMARMRNLKNVTIEGVGDDAVVSGWGFHFMAGSDQGTEGRGKGFEVRNITFEKVPEDCVGMEGVQTSAGITGSVERCWVHNNVFLEGYCANPAESDKGEGDGSCDFKRGQFFTLSYNYFINCHKTNLIGSSDSSYQYNITMHHNMWVNCKARIPLIRQANCHYYNNYVYGESGGTMDQVHSLRANSYVFSEANFYEGRKKVAEDKGSGGVAKGWKNIYSSCFDEHSITDVTSREEYVANKCTHCGGITLGAKADLSHFDTDPELFYYDAENKKTDALVDDPVSARTRVLQYVGTLGFTKQNTVEMLSANEHTPSGTVTNGEVDLSKAAAGSTVNGVYFNDFKGGKGKGQLMTFTLSAPTLVNITGTGKAADHYPQLIRSDGKVVITKFNGSVSVELGAGTYVVTSGQKDKESSISALSFEEAEGAAEARLQAAITALNAIPQSITRNSKTLIDNAKKAYGALSAEQKQQINAELYSRYTKAANAYSQIAVEYVIARIEYIGTVTEYSDNDIKLARQAYNDIDNTLRASVTNYQKLVTAETEFAEFALDNLQNEIDRLPVYTALGSVDSRPAVELAISLYEAQLGEYSALEEDDKEKITITNVNEALKVLNAKLAEIAAGEKEAENLVKFNALLAETTVENVTLASGSNLKSVYESLTAAQKEGIKATDKAKYEAIIEKYTAAASQAVNITFLDGKPSNNEIIKSTGAKQSAKKTSFIVNAYSATEELKTGLKFEASTELTLTLATKMTVSFYLLNFDTANTIAVNGNAVELKQVGGDNVATITLEAGTYKIARAKSENSLYYMTLVPAN